MTSKGFARPTHIRVSLPCCRFTEVARAVQQLPAQLYVSEQDLQAKSAHELKVNVMSAVPSCLLALQAFMSI